MISLYQLPLFISASLLLSLAPGPDNIFVLTQSMAHGKKTGITITLGLCTGLVVHTMLVAFGLATIFKTSQLAFAVIKYSGAVYLAYLAVQYFRHLAGPGLSDNRVPYTKWEFYRRGIIMNLTNPKVSIFFMAFLPQFARPEAGRMSIQLVCLGLIFIIIALTVFTAISFFSGIIGKKIKKSGHMQKLLNAIAGTVLGLLALRLVLLKQ